MSRKRRCFHVPSFGGLVFDLEDDPAGTKATDLIRYIREWAQTAKPDAEFVLRAKRFTQTELDNMEEWSGP